MSFSRKAAYSFAVPLLVALALAAMPHPAIAHVEQGQATGFLTGLRHPWSGLDHVLAMIAVGLWGAQLGNPALWLLPVTFPMMMSLGAVMGLIHVMENLSDPSKLGAGIAVAFVATIYGVAAANLFFLPVAKKLLAHVARLVAMREMLVDGLVGVANGDNPRVIESRLQGYIV